MQAFAYGRPTQIRRHCFEHCRWCLPNVVAVSYCRRTTRVCRRWSRSIARLIQLARPAGAVMISSRIPKASSSSPDIAVQERPAFQVAVLGPDYGGPAIEARSLPRPHSGRVCAQSFARREPPISADSPFRCKAERRVQLRASCSRRLSKTLLKGRKVGVLLNCVWHLLQVIVERERASVLLVSCSGGDDPASPQARRRARPLRCSGSRAATRAFASPVCPPHAPQSGRSHGELFWQRWTRGPRAMISGALGRSSTWPVRIVLRHRH